MKRWHIKNQWMCTKKVYGRLKINLKTHTSENIWQVQTKTQRKGKTPSKIRGYLIIELNRYNIVLLLITFINHSKKSLPSSVSNTNLLPPNCLVLTMLKVRLEKIYFKVEDEDKDYEDIFCHWLVNRLFMSNLPLSFIFFMRLESFLSRPFLPISKARTNMKLIEMLWNQLSATYLVELPQILQPVALLMFRVEAIPMFLLTVPIQICQVKLVLSFIFFMRLESFLSHTFLPVSEARTNKLCFCDNASI
jgi:hypothetical protein